MLSNFWTQWIISTALIIVGACVIGIISKNWILGIMGYFILGILKDSYLIATHMKKVDNNSKSV